MPTIERVEGLREIERALKELPKATGKTILRNALKKRAKPIADAARAAAPVRAVGGGQLRDSIAVSTKLSRRQASLARKEGKSAVEVYAGAGPLPQAHLEEFGGPNNAPRPFMRPAWDQHKDGVLRGLADDLWKSIERAARRLANKKA